MVKNTNELNNSLPSLESLIGEGVDHINIYINGESELGKMLSHSYRMSINHSVFGRFSTMESFWYYIQSEHRNDEFRVLHGSALRKLFRKTPSKTVPSFKAIIMDANWQKIKHYKLEQMIADTSLPFDIYYIKNDSNLKIRPTFAKWLLAGFEEIRRAIKEDREPDFTFLLDKGNDSLESALDSLHSHKTNRLLKKQDYVLTEDQIQRLEKHFNNS